MPDDSQVFVEASALSLDDVDWAEQEELSEYARKHSRAGGVVIRAYELTDPEADLATLECLTGHQVDEETATRLIEPPSITALIVDIDGTYRAPGAWQGSITELAAVEGQDRAGLRSAMEASVP